MKSHTFLNFRSKLLSVMTFFFISWNESSRNGTKRILFSSQFWNPIVAMLLRMWHRIWLKKKIHSWKSERLWLLRLFITPCMVEERVQNASFRYEQWFCCLLASVGFYDNASIQHNDSKSWQRLAKYLSPLFLFVYLRFEKMLEIWVCGMSDS